MSVFSFTDAYQARHGHAPEVCVSKPRLAAQLGRSTRWVELRMKEGMPVHHRDARGWPFFDPAQVAAWLEARAA